MEVISRQLGQLQYTDDQVLTFKDGLLGFESLRRFLLVELEETLPFEWLVSLDDPNFSFPLLAPTLEVTDYNLESIKTEKNQIFTDHPESSIVYCIANLSGDVPTINLRGPVIINEKSRRGKQVVLNDDTFSFSRVLETGMVEEGT